MDSYQCRLLVVGKAKDLDMCCCREDWPVTFTEVELLEKSPTRRSWQFTAPIPPLPYLRNLSARWPRLTFLLDHDTGRVKGLANGKAGKVRHHRFVYAEDRA